jgi:hypothetical protein
MFIVFICVVGIVFTNYDRYVFALKWMTLSLFAYVAALLAAKVHWTAAITGMLLPRIRWNAAFFTTLVAILGTTISPYLFFWQACPMPTRVSARIRRNASVACRGAPTSGFRRRLVFTSSATSPAAILRGWRASLMRARNQHRHLMRSMPRPHRRV